MKVKSTLREKLHLIDRFKIFDQDEYLDCIKFLSRVIFICNTTLGYIKIDAKKSSIMCPWMFSSSLVRFLMTAVQQPKIKCPTNPIAHAHGNMICRK